MIYLALLYVIGYYVINIVVFQIYCVRQPSNYPRVMTSAQQFAIDATCNSSNLCQAKENLTKQLSAMNNNYPFCSKTKKFMNDLAVEEDDFIRILTYLIGFYLKFTIMRWWSQVNSVPRIDAICLALEGSIWCTPGKNKDQIAIMKDVSVTQFKQAIVRYCLLSWTMCISLIAPSLRQELKNPEDFSRLRLMNHDEYQKLKPKKSDSKDVWKRNWSVPLLWVNSMLNELETKSANIKDIKIKALKENHKATTRFQRQLQKLVFSNVNKLPHLVEQATNIGLIVWLLLGMWSTQQYHSPENGVPIPMALILNFPVLHVAELFLVFSWLETATLLVNPFGFDM